MQWLIRTQNSTFVQNFIKVLKKDLKEISSINYQFLAAWQLTKKIPFTIVFQGILVNFF